MMFFVVCVRESDHSKHLVQKKKKMDKGQEMLCRNLRTIQ